MMPRAEFAESIGSNVWGAFKRIYDTIDDGTDKIAIRSCNGAGKTHFLATLAAFELLKAQQDKYSLAVIVSAATATQLRNALWAAIKRQCRKAKVSADFTAMKAHVRDDVWCIGVNPQKIESGQGYHADRVVVMIDEASGFTMEMLSALLSNATGGSRLQVLTFNPTETESAVFDIEENDKSWKFFEISAFDHPNVITGEEIIEGAVTRTFIDSVLYGASIECNEFVDGAIFTEWNGKYWQPTPEANARICGKWSLAASHGFIPMSEILLCCKDSVENKSGLRSMGVDIAGGGADDSAASIFFGNEQQPYEKISTHEFKVIAEWIVGLTQKYGIDLVCIDDTGVGQAVSERLRENKSLKAILIPVNFAQKPKGFELIRQPSNARAEMYLCLEKEIRSQQIKLFYDQSALKEIAAARIVAQKGSTNIKLEDKSLIKRRLGRSPDKADACALARYGVRLLHYHNQPRLL